MPSYSEICNRFGGGGNYGGKSNNNNNNKSSEGELKNNNNNIEMNNGKENGKKVNASNNSDESSDCNKKNNNNNNNKDNDNVVIMDTSSYKLHHKNVPPLSRQKLYDLQCHDPSKRSRMVQMHRFLHDVSLYENNVQKKSANGCPWTNVRDEFLQQLVDDGNMKVVKRSEVKGHVKFFVIPEHFKKRFRQIRNTEDINETFGKETLIGIKFPSKKNICEMVLQGSHFVAFDMSSYYDQFELENGVGNFMCCRKNGKFYASSRLAMGQRQGCDIGQTTTEFLMDFPERKTKTGYAVIDNAIFVGSFEECLHDAKTFVARCKAAGVTLNETEVIEKDGIESLIQTSGEWCGVSLDFTKKSVKLTDKTIKKIEDSWLNRHNWSYRQFSAHIGLLFWTWGIIDVPVHNYYSLLKCISETSRRLQADESLWDTPAVINQSAIGALEKWTLLSIKNESRKLKESSDPKWFICTDASALGWGYVAMNAETGEIRCFGQAWTRQQLIKIFSRNGTHKIKKSVYSEPLAIYFSLCHFLKDNGSKYKIEFAEQFKNDLKMKIKIYTDNASAQHTMNRGFASRSFDINEAIRKLKETFLTEEFDFEFCFVPGWCNPADPFSRGKYNNNVNASNGHKSININNLQRDMGKVINSTESDLSTRHSTD